MIGILIKNRLRAVFGSAVGRAGKGKEIKKPSALKITLFAILYLYVAVVFLGISVGAAYLLSKALLPGAGWLYYLIFIGLSLTLIFILGIFETKTELFDCKDNDLLLSMPIKPRDIVAARIFIVLIYNYIINAIIMLPAIVFFAIYGKSLAGVIGGILLFIFVPILATALASFIGYLVAELSRKIKYKNLATVIITFAFIGVYFWLVNLFNENIEVVLANLAGMSDKLAENFKILLFIGEAALLKPLSLLAVVGVSLASGIIAYCLISAAYIRIVTDRTGAKKAVYKEKRLRKSNVTLSLAMRDIRHFFASPIYILNGALGLVMGVIMAVLAIVNKDTVFSLAEMLGASSTAIANVAIGLLNLLSSTVIISACALSIEGKNFWIIKSMPIKSGSVLFSKALMQYLISAPCVLVSSILLLIAAMPAPYLWPIYIIAAQISAAMLSLFGILINVVFPKFTYENEAQAVKQSLSTIIYMMSAMIITLGLLVGVFFLSLFSEVLGILLLIGVPTVLTAIEVVLIAIPASKRLERLNL